MSSADWEEVKRLAADFQRAQLTATSQRLTEKNCIEIVNRLMELKLLDVVYTSDGKEYVTPAQLVKEIQDELFVHGGRLSLTALATSLNVSQGVVEARVGELLKGSQGLHFVLGQLITSAYIQGLVEDLNEKLVQDGMILLSEVSKTADLPGDWLQEQVEKRLGKVVHGKVDREDPNLIYTEAFVRRNTARIRGILSGVTKPTPINQILLRLGGNGLPEKLFFGIIEKLIASKRIEGMISGGNNRSAYYIPSAYSKAQTGWIDSFMSGNGYVDLGAAAGVGISDPKSFISKRFPNQALIFLKGVVLGEALFAQVKEGVEEGLQGGGNPGWVDVGSLLPFSVSEEDMSILLDRVLTGVKDAMVFDSIVVSKKLLGDLKAEFKPLMGEKAAKDISSGKYIQLVNETRAAEKKSKLGDFDEGAKGGKKDDRRKKAAAGKAGGGTQGRETKTKATKKKYLAGKNKDKDDWSDSDEDAPIAKGPSSSSTTSLSSSQTGKKGALQLEFQSVKEISKAIGKNDALADAPPELLQSVSHFISGGLQEEYQTVLKEAFEKFMSEKCGKKSQEEVLEKLFKMVSMFRLYAQGLANFEGELRNGLEKFLLKSTGAEIGAAATTFLLMESGLDETCGIGDLPEGKVKEAMMALGKATDVEAFNTCLECILPPVKKSAKNAFSPRNLLLESRAALLTELDGAQASSDAALFLHIAVLFLFSCVTETLVQASGKFVSQLIAFLSGKLTVEESASLRECHDRVVSLIKLKNGPGAEEAKEALASNILPSIKSLVLSRQNKS